MKTPPEMMELAVAYATLMHQKSDTNNVNAALNAMVDALAAGPRRKNCEVLIALVTLIAAHLEELPRDQRRMAAAGVSVLLAEAIGG